MHARLTNTYHIYLTMQMAPTARNILNLPLAKRRQGFRYYSNPLSITEYVVVLTCPGVARANRAALMRWVLNGVRAYIAAHPEDGCE